MEVLLLFGGTKEGAEHVPLKNHHEGVRGVAGVVGDERFLFGGALRRIGVDFVQDAQLFSGPGVRVWVMMPCSRGMMSVVALATSGAWSDSTRMRSMAEKFSLTSWLV